MGKIDFAKSSVADIAILSGKRVKPQVPYREFSKNLQFNQPIPGNALSHPV
jgi:hypothetical protein